jgi:hypothetical protein
MAKGEFLPSAEDNPNGDGYNEIWTKFVTGSQFGLQFASYVQQTMNKL